MGFAPFDTLTSEDASFVNSDGMAQGASSTTFEDSTEDEIRFGTAFGANE